MAKKEKELNNKKGRYFKDMKAELKKVVWPAPKQLANSTFTVIAFTLIIALIVFVLDVCFDAINKHGVVALQEKVTSSYNSKNNEENTTSDNTTDSNTSTESNESSAQNSTDNSVNVEVETETKTENNENEKSENKTDSNSTKN